MASLKVSKIESIEVIDEVTNNSIIYKRKQGKTIFKMTYNLNTVDEGKVFCPRCGVEYKEEEYSTCPNCKEDEYSVITVAEVPELIYSYIEDDLTIKITLWDGTESIMKL